jgi:hypothetical protein
MPIAGPANCAQEYRTASRSADAAQRARASIADKCTDILTAQLAACAATVDGMISSDATNGCLLATHAAAVASMIDDQYGNGLTGLELNYDALRSCQIYVAKAGRLLATSRLADLQKCRNKLNKGRLFFFDDDDTMPLTNPVDCAAEYKTAAHIAAKGLKARALVADHCSDALVADLGGTCAATVDGLISPGGSSGCLVDGHETQSDEVIDAEY